MRFANSARSLRSVCTELCIFTSRAARTPSFASSALASLPVSLRSLQCTRFVSLSAPLSSHRSFRRLGIFVFFTQHAAAFRPVSRPIATSPRRTFPQDAAQFTSLQFSACALCAVRVLLQPFRFTSLLFVTARFACFASHVLRLCHLHRAASTCTPFTLRAHHPPYVL